MKNNLPCPILIVDDDNDLCLILETRLRKICDVHVEHDLRSAENYLSKLKPQIVLLDNNLPDGTGVDSIGNMLAQYSTIKIILMTADTSAGLKERAMHEGAVSFIAKPFRMAEMSALIFSVCPGFRAA